MIYPPGYSCVQKVYNRCRIVKQARMVYGAMSKEVINLSSKRFAFIFCTFRVVSERFYIFPFACFLVFSFSFTTFTPNNLKYF